MTEFAQYYLTLVPITALGCSSREKAMNLKHPNKKRKFAGGGDTVDKCSLTPAESRRLRGKAPRIADAGSGNTKETQKRSKEYQIGKGKFYPAYLSVDLANLALAEIAHC